MNSSVTGCLVLLFAATAATAAPPAQRYDVVVYGGTSAGITAAIYVKQQGKSVVVVSPDTHLGGVTSGGLSWTDSGNKAVIGGLSREFYRRVKKHYDRPEAWVYQKAADYKQYRADEDAMWVFEPHVAERTYDEWVKEMQIPLVRDAWLDREKGVKKQ